MSSQAKAVLAAGSSEFDGLLDELSATLGECASDAIASRIGAAVSQAAGSLGFDYGWLSQGYPDGGPAQFAPVWARPGQDPLPPFDPAASLPWITNRLEAETGAWLVSADSLPSEAVTDRTFLRQAGVRSLACLPLIAAGRPAGWLVIATARESAPFSARAIASLNRMAAAIVGPLARAWAETALRRATEFDRVLAELAASLIHVAIEVIDAQIVTTLETVGELLGADRASVVQDVAPEHLVMRTHQWVREGTTRPPLSDSKDAFPWLINRVFEARELVALTRLDDLPPEAARDRATLARNGVVSGAIAPMVVENRVVGLLLFATATRVQRWSQDLIVRLRLVGEIVASAIARRDTELALRATLADNERLREALATENVYLKAELGEGRDFEEIVGRSDALRETLAKVRHVADTDAPVLLLGETGTGKELLGRALHGHGARRDRAFIAVNCAALPAGLIESELFGYEKGAFTGASQAKPGRFELADKGTLLLDEIGDLDPALQAKLLRVLENGEIQRLGATVTRKVDVRIIAATNRDLHRDMREGRFRSDLYYRLGVFPINVPPLRERREDIHLLVWHFVESRQRALRRAITRIPKTTMAALEAYDWPGNIRELQNVIERALILSQGAVLRIDEAFGAEGRAETGRRSSVESLEDVEHAHIVQVLDRCRWTIEGRGQAAERLGLNPSTLRNRMRKLGIKRPAR